MSRRDKPVRGKRHRQDMKDRWLITYADLITLLLIFFVVMYAMSRLDVEKYEIVTESLQHTFKSGDSLLEHGTGILGGDTNDTRNGGQGGATDSGPKAGGNGQGQDGSSDLGQKPLTERELAFRKQEEELQNLMSRIESYIKENQLEDQINVADLPKGISITLSDRFMFDTGRADLKQDAAQTLSKLASLFSDLNTVVSIEGHTDNMPIGRGSAFKDNWELSGARALSVLRYFIDKEKLDPEGFQYAGYADTRPSADNSTSAGRQKNRRVEITVLRQLQQ